MTVLNQDIYDIDQGETLEFIARITKAGNPVDLSDAEEIKWILTRSPEDNEPLVVLIVGEDSEIEVISDGGTNNAVHVTIYGELTNHPPGFYFHGTRIIDVESKPYIAHKGKVQIKASPFI